jgi:magnesium transporter
MNFVHMPELQWRFGYLYALVLMFGSAGMLWLYFRRRGWL